MHQRRNNLGMILTPFARHTLAIFAAAIILCIAGFTLSTCMNRSASQKRDAVVARETGKALDTVTTKTETIRTEQKAKTDAVNEIKGSDARLPDGYGSDLQRLRDGKRN